MTEGNVPDEIIVSSVEKPGQGDLGDCRVVRFGDKVEVQTRLSDGEQWYYRH